LTLESGLVPEPAWFLLILGGWRKPCLGTELDAGAAVEHEAPALLSSHVHKFRGFQASELKRRTMQPVENADRSPEMTKFDKALREVMTVSKEDLKRLQAEDRARKADKPKRGRPKLQK
jgi:hypothetical protein